MDASDLIKALQNTLQGGGRPHMENQPGELSLAGIKFRPVSIRVRFFSTNVLNHGRRSVRG
jgi:hypothetical protein